MKYFRKEISAETVNSVKFIVHDLHIEFWPSYWNCGITFYFYDFMQSDTRRDSNFNTIHSESFFQIKFGKWVLIYRFHVLFI